MATATPDPLQVLELLELRSVDVGDGELEMDEELDMLDFTLPDHVTNYVICVSFDEGGNVTGVTMES